MLTTFSGTVGGQVRQVLLYNYFYVVCFLVGNSPAFEFYTPTFRNTLFYLHTYLPIKMEQIAPKRRHV